MLRGVGCVQPRAVLVGRVRSALGSRGFRGRGLGEHRPPLTALFLSVQQDAPHRPRGARQPPGLAVPLCCFLPLEQAPLPRVELPPGHPAARGHRHLPVRVHRPLGRPLASEPCRCVWGLTLPRPHVIPRVGIRLLLLPVLSCVCFGGMARLHPAPRLFLSISYLLLLSYPGTC